MTAQKELHYNVPQLKAALVAAYIMWLIFGRGTGKTEGVLAPHVANNFLETMPRSSGVNVCATYKQALTNTLPGLTAGWSKMGYREGIHYIVGRKPTEKWKAMWNWKGPHRMPMEWKYIVSWWNGSIFHLISQDRVGSSNGLSIDWLFGDEAKLLNEEKLKTELFPANRGNLKEFSASPYHHGMCFTTDMPVGTAGRWILDMESKMDSQRVNEILQLQTIVYDIKQRKKQTKDKYFNRQMDRQLTVLLAEINRLRRGLIFYDEASTLTNIDVLGLDYIKDQILTTSPLNFNTQILNRKPKRVEDGFYPCLDEDKHGYFADSISFFEQFDFHQLTAGKEEINDNCLQDEDLNWDAPLHISLDYNKSIWPLVVGQVDRHDEYREAKTIKELYSLYPGKLKDVLKKFDAYYRPKMNRNKVVYYWYDHTAVGELRDTTLAEEVVDTLSKMGWIVIGLYIGQQPSHETRYNMFQNLMGDELSTYPFRWRINRGNCPWLLRSMFLTETIRGKKGGFEKNKKAEHDEKADQRETTHFSDANDTFIYGVVASEMDYESSVDRGIGGVILM